MDVRQIVAHLNRLLETALLIELSDHQAQDSWHQLQACLSEIASAWSVDLYKRLLGEPYRESAKSAVNNQILMALDEAQEAVANEEAIVTLIGQTRSMWRSYYSEIDDAPGTQIPDSAQAIRQLSSLLDVIEEARPA
jgi:hypothetical protein